MDDVSGEWGQLFYTWSGNTVTWYSTQSKVTQQNLDDTTYIYFVVL